LDDILVQGGAIMSGIIHFSSGKTLEITEAEFRVISPKLNGKGIKTQTTAAGHKIPLNSMTMEYIEHVPEKEDKVINPEPVLAPVKLPTVMDQDKPKTNDEIVAEMTAKSNCKHEPEKLELYRQHTAKGIRYFPVCSFCGKRERYVSESKIVKDEYDSDNPNSRWTSEDVINAKDWIDK